jgi:CheY-like chemotaxis protein
LPGAREQNWPVLSAGKPLRVVLVDDNAEFLESATQLLEHEGLSIVAAATTSVAALQHIRRLRPDVALVDVDLGEDSGFELAAALHGLCGTPVILTSIHAEQDLAELLQDSPAIAFLPKATLCANEIREAFQRLNGDRHRQHQV